MRNDTIFALSTAPGRAGVAVVRVSGPQAGAALDALAGTRPPARLAQLREIHVPEDNEPLDRGLVIWFPAPQSFTGEDVAEFQVHGGRAVVAGLLEALGGQAGLRPAEPGEFSRRAFEGGRMDLAQVEGLADLIEAETAAQRSQALRQMEGGLSELVGTWRRTLIQLSALVAADIDFPDEDDVPGGLTAKARPGIAVLAAELEAQLAKGDRAARLREGLEVAILGAPNVGKSSILNALAGRDAAIVSSLAGTTRDVVEVHMDLGGYPVALADTAGLREAADEIESEGVSRALERARRADLRLIIFDARAWPEADLATREAAKAGDVIVLNKADEAEGLVAPETLWGTALLVSAKTGQGLAELETRLGAEVIERAGISETPAITRQRHRKALEDAIGALHRAEAALEAELCGEDLRLAARALERLLGKVDVEDLLDVIFAEFCIGK
ncbi:tRNA uridine-5-carboxymethylaminomethyl(34) synthesis GTPase MnmE [bacterium AH-315-P15]|nr:tRNA uridine-5-carboxymethylaminomethyl(34) synthesis GTPase MnmE [bacterium AH-315-P15]